MDKSPANGEPFPSGSLIKLKNGELIGTPMSTSYLKYVRRNKLTLTLKGKDGKDRVLRGKDIQHVISTEFVPNKAS